MPCSCLVRLRSDLLSRGTIGHPSFQHLKLADTDLRSYRRSSSYKGYCGYGTGKATSGRRSTPSRTRRMCVRICRSAFFGFPSNIAAVISATEEIRQLTLKYTRYINQRDWERWVNLFTDQSDYWQYTIGKVVTGPKGWRRHLDAVGMTSDKMHSLFENLGNAEIEILPLSGARDAPYTV